MESRTRALMQANVLTTSRSTVFTSPTRTCESPKACFDPTAEFLALFIPRHSWNQVVIIDSAMWRLILLGDLALQCNGLEVRRLRAQKYAHLLAYLALWPNRAHSRAELLEIFWPDEPLENAQMCLRTALASLRRQLNVPNLLMAGQREIVKLTPGILETDVHEFERAALAGDPAGLRLYNGPLLPGCYYDWALDESNRLQSLFDQLQSRCGKSVEQNGLPDALRSALAVPDTSSKKILLPSPLSKLYGRQSEVDDLQRILSEDCRLVTLVGLGGIGKTRLAIEVGRSLPVRVALVEFAGETSAVDIPNRIGAALGLERAPAEDFVERVQCDLDQQPTVLVLDNLEELAETGSLGFVDRLLHRIPTLKVLATSRIPLGLAGERIFPVPPLSLESARDMFLDRARCALPDFAESSSLSELCDRLDCFPLAIELCASWAPLMSSARMLAALSDRFQWLETHKRGVSDRHRSLAAVLRWACPPDGPLRLPLQRLSVLQGRWPLEAAEAVLGTDCMRSLHRLQERALLQVHSDEDEPTFSILQSVREYAVEGALETDMRSAQERHCRYYCRLATLVAKSQPIDAQRAFRKLDQDHQNIFAAFDFGLGESDELVEVVIHAFDATKWCWWVRGYEEEVKRLVARVSTLDTGRFSRPVAGLLLRASANHAMNEGRSNDALQACREAIQIWEQCEQRGRLADAHHIYAVYLGQAGKYEEAESTFLRHLESIKHDPRAYMVGLASLAAMLKDSGSRYERAQEYYLQMIAFWQAESDGESHVAVLKSALAECLIVGGEFQKAENNLVQAIDVLSRLGERVREASAWESLATALDGQNRTEDARKAGATAALLRKAVPVYPKV
jgi:predicted ATPase/Flp pilus assembly protein TadD